MCVCVIVEHTTIDVNSFYAKVKFLFSLFFLLSCGNFIKFVVALKFFRSQLSKRKGKKDAMQQQQQQREKKTVHLYPHNTHILYTDEEPPKTKRGEIGTTNKILESIARRGTTQYNTCAI